MSNTLLRQLAMLKHIPRHKGKITTKQIVTLLKSEGYDIHQRSVQRDLKTLSKYFPGLQTDGNKDIAGWSWKQECAIQDFPTIDSSTALTFKMTETFMSKLMPPSILNLLKPYFDRSSAILTEVDKSGLTTWADKIRIVPRSMPLIPATIKQETISVIYNALLEEKQFRGRYIRRDGDEAEYAFHPQGLVFRESVVYLVATVWDYRDLRHYSLHRFTACELLDEDLIVPANFSLDTYLKQGSFQYGDTANIRLTAIFVNDAARHLTETPLSDDQRLVTKNDGTIQVTATVNDSLQLRWWLLGFSDRIEIIKPLKLRNEFKKIAASMNKLYSR